MAKQTETTREGGSKLEVATRVLIRMEGLGKEHARRFLKRCTADEIERIAACDCSELDCGREVGDKFRSEFGAVMDAVVRRQEADDEKSQQVKQ